MSQETNSTELRKFHHEVGKKLLRSGSYSEALQVLIKTKEDFGNNVNLQADIVCCHYVLGNIHSWQKSLAELEEGLRNAICPASKVSATMTLAQNLEENGNISKAYILYKKLAPEVASLRDSLATLWASQIVRLEGQFFESSEMGQDCLRWLMHLSSVSSTHNVNVDVQHSLFLYEVHRSSPLIGQIRLRELLSKRQYLNDLDRCLFLVDLLELQIRFETLLSPELHEEVEKTDFHLSGAYGVLLKKLWSSGDVKALMPYFIAESMSLANRMRWCYLAYLRTQDVEIKAGLWKLLNSYFSMLPAEDSAIWKKAFAEQLAQTLPILWLDLQNRMATFARSQYLMKKKQSLLLVALFENKQALLAEDLCRELWNLPYDLSSKDRLRMAVMRVNQELKEELNVPVAFKIAEGVVTIQVKLKMTTQV